MLQELVYGEHSRDTNMNFYHVFLCGSSEKYFSAPPAAQDFTFALAAEALVGFLPWPEMYEMRFLTTKMTKIFEVYSYHLIESDSWILLNLGVFSVY